MTAISSFLQHLKILSFNQFFLFQLLQNNSGEMYESMPKLSYSYPWYACIRSNKNQKNIFVICTSVNLVYFKWGPTKVPPLPPHRPDISKRWPGIQAEASAQAWAPLLYS